MAIRVPRLPAGVVVLLGLLAAFPFLPAGLLDVWYDGIGALCVGYGYLGLRRRRPAHHRSWLLVIAGLLGWVAGDVISSFEAGPWHLDYYPVPSDAVYLGSYLVLGAGLLGLARGKRTRHDLSVALDAAIIATGVAVLAGVFVLAPISDDSTLTLAGKLVSASYPLADVSLIAILVRLWITPGGRTPAFRFLNAALLVTLLGDFLWDVRVVSTGVSDTTVWNSCVWLLGYIFMAAACWSPSVQDATHTPGRSERANPRLHLSALAGGMMLPAVALLLNGLAGGQIHWMIVGVGSIALSVLALTRAAGLLRVVQIQAVQLAALARSDSLTGAPNRRTWDHELSRACQVARQTGETLCVALIDLDDFKAYNDRHGHQAGDRLLREAVATWTDLLDDGEVLARYGGEEFAVLLPNRTLSEARTRLNLLREATPGHQTFSAGVATWDSSTDPAAALAAADEAMYDAKRSGRNRVCLAGSLASTDRLPTPTMVLQPIVDLLTGSVVGMEALSRFEGDNPQTVFERAHRAGVGPELEALAIRKALLCRPPGVPLSLNVSLASLTDPHVVDVLPEDLSGITLEVTEHSDVDTDVRLEGLLHDLRRRGALLAVDDWGRGFANLDRLLRLRPEVVKLDLTLVHGLDSDYHRATIKSVTAWAAEVGVLVCAEGVETEEQRHTLLQLGVELAQGYLFGRPAAPDAFLAPAGVALPAGEPTPDV
jgi:diguanylate cyclase